MDDLFSRYADVVKQLRIEKSKNKILEEKLQKAACGHLLELPEITKFKSDNKDEIPSITES